MTVPPDDVPAVVPPEGTPSVAPAVSEPQNVRWWSLDADGTQLTFPLPEDWRRNVGSTFTGGPCGALVEVTARALESGASADEQVRDAIGDGEVLATTSGGLMAFRLVQQADRLTGVEVLPLEDGGDRWARVDVVATGDCDAASLAAELQGPLSQLLAELRPR
jgi:hypothetical protein